ncbi:MAG: pantoate--beta-alanine ligase [Burkholderiales bacterium]|nr:pantoate--beta-alanine ligase [Burkholderiales bacterium]
MQVLHHIPELRARLNAEPRVTLVPTMGNLHAGHISLVEMARWRGGCVVATIFVNRLQFDPGGDFDRYPRTLARDTGMLEAAGCDVVFVPDEREMYPEPQEAQVTPPRIASDLEGAFRPGHFQGVCTVVTKLFNIVKPHAAVFGKKDYQQLAVLRAMERQLDFGIEIVGGETMREPDGLAMSSRNGYLTKDERVKAAQLNAELRKVKEALEAGSRRFERHTAMARADLETAGWKVDYVEVRNRATLELPAPHDKELVVLAAARLGKTRLIDNLEITA